MVISPLAAGTLEQFRIVGVEVKHYAWVQDRVMTALAGHAECATGHGCEDVIGVHGAKNQGFPRPLFFTSQAPDSIGSLKAPHADCV